MRRKLAIGILGLMVLLASAMISTAQEGGPPAAPGQGQHQFGGGPHGWGNGRPAFAQGRGRFGMEGRMGWQHGRRGMGGLLFMAQNPRVRQALGLTDDQVQRLHTLGVDAQKASIQNRADLELRQLELRELMRADNPDDNAIMQKLDQINALRGKMAKERVQTLLSARSVLTPDQLKKIKTFMENRGFAHGPERGRMMYRRGMPGGRPQGPGGPGGAPPAQPQTPPTQ